MSSPSDSSASSSCSASFRASSSAFRRSSFRRFSSILRLLFTHAIMSSSSAAAASPSCLVERLRCSMVRFSFAAAILAASAAVSASFASAAIAARSVSSTSRRALSRSLSPCLRGFIPSFSRTRLVSSRDMETSPPALDVLTFMASGKSSTEATGASPSSISASEPIVRVGSVRVP